MCARGKRAAPLATRVAPTRLLLVEFRSDDPCRQFRSDLYPFVLGYARSIGAETRWICLGVDSACRPDNYHIVEPGPIAVQRMVAILEDFAPATVVFNERMGANLDRMLDERFPAIRRVTVGEDTPRFGSISVSLVADWVGAPPPRIESGRDDSIINFGVPDYGCENLDPEAPQVHGFIPLEAGSPCEYNRSLDDNPFFEGIMPALIEGARGCSFCQGHTPDPAHRAPRSRAGSAADAALVQVRRFLATAPPERRSWHFRVGSPRIFQDLLRFFEGILELPLPPSTFYFARRVDEFLNRADDLESVLPRLERNGHSVVMQCMGVENFSPRENQRFNKGISLEQVEAAFTRLDGWERRFPSTVVFFRLAGFNTILFTPWTALEDLDLNVAALRRLSRITPALLHAIPQMTTRLIIHPGTPIEVLAERDGLTLDAFREPMPRVDCGLDFWDAVERPWRFANEDTAMVFRIASRFDNKCWYDDAPPLPYVLSLREQLEGLRRQVLGGRWAFLDVLAALIEATRQVGAPWAVEDVFAALEARLADVSSSSPDSEQRLRGCVRVPTSAPGSMDPISFRRERGRGDEDGNGGNEDFGEFGDLRGPDVPPALRQLADNVASWGRALRARDCGGLGGYQVEGATVVHEGGEFCLAIKWRREPEGGGFDVRVATGRLDEPAFSVCRGMRIWYVGDHGGMTSEQRRVLRAVVRLCERN